MGVPRACCKIRRAVHWFALFEQFFCGCWCVHFKKFLCTYPAPLCTTLASLPSLTPSSLTPSLPSLTPFPSLLRHPCSLLRPSLLSCTLLLRSSLLLRLPCPFLRPSLFSYALLITPRPSSLTPSLPSLTPFPPILRLPCPILRPSLLSITHTPSLLRPFPSSLTPFLLRPSPPSLTPTHS